MDGVTRREVLATAGAAAVVCCLAGCEKEKEKPALILTGTVSVGPAGDYPAGRANAKYMDTYGIIIANDSGTPVAIRGKCTHMGCAVAWDPAARGYECSCHHSKFTLLGLPISGPARRPLPLIACTREADGMLSVDLTKLNSL